MSCVSQDIIINSDLLNQFVDSRKFVDQSELAHQAVLYLGLNYCRAIPTLFHTH
jgi:hypothetical protein